MHDELSDRQTAIRLCLACESMESLCHTLHRSETWFRQWWERYLTAGPERLYDLTRANRQVVSRTPPHIERAVLSIRRRLAAHAALRTRCCLIEAATVREELKALGHMPLASCAPSSASSRRRA